LCPDEDKDLLELGRLIHETSYQREKEGITYEGMKIDIIRKESNNVIIAEIKKSSKFQEASIMQLGYYLFRLKEQGLNLKGQLLIPKEKRKIEVILTEELEKKLKYALKDIHSIMNEEVPPQVKKCKYCSKCAYLELCFA
jgi:CRISPR-associated exonuclease Cas4